MIEIKKTLDIIEDEIQAQFREDVKNDVQKKIAHLENEIKKQGGIVTISFTETGASVTTSNVDADLEFKIHDALEDD